MHKMGASTAPGNAKQFTELLIDVQMFLCTCKMLNIFDDMYFSVIFLRCNPI